jgi:hypothetical protein
MKAQGIKNLLMFFNDAAFFIGGMLLMPISCGGGLIDHPFQDQSFRFMCITALVLLAPKTLIVSWRGLVSIYKGEPL